MNAPTPAQQIAALAALSGLTPDPQMTRDVATAAMIYQAKASGATWRQIGSCFGLTDPAAAKAHWKRAARAANMGLIAAAVEKMKGGGDGE